MAAPILLAVGTILLGTSLGVAWVDEPVDLEWQHPGSPGLLIFPGQPGASGGFHFDFHVYPWGVAVESDGERERSSWFDEDVDHEDGYWRMVFGFFGIVVGLAFLLIAAGWSFAENPDARRITPWESAAAGAVLAAVGVALFSWGFDAAAAEASYDWRAGFWIAWTAVLALVAGMIWNYADRPEPSESST